MMFLPVSKANSDRQIVLLAPTEAKVPNSFNRIRYDADHHRSLLAGMQRLRGAVYLADGAIDSMSLSPDGRHWTSTDNESWHILSVDAAGRVCGCARYLPHKKGSMDFARLSVGRSALAQSEVWSSFLTKAVERDMMLARQRGIDYVEVGGWALTEELRRSTEGLRIALATYALGRKLGGCIGVTTATVRHGSASILRKLGGTSMVVDGIEVPRYYDPQYECDMEILRFESSNPNSRYETWIERIDSQLSAVPVISNMPAPRASGLNRIPALPACSHITDFKPEALTAA